MSSKIATISSTQTLVDQQFLEDAQTLLKIRSTRERPIELRHALEYIVSRLRRHPTITVERFQRNGIHSIVAYVGKERPERFSILLNGHVDVVPGKDSDFSPYIKDNRMYGRGALDMKVAALVMTDVFCQVADKVSYPLGLQIVTDEEDTGQNGVVYQMEQGVKTDFFITGEQSDNNIVTETKGVCWMKIKHTGRASHGAYLWKGENAVLKLTEIIRRIHVIYPVPKEEVWQSTASISQFQTTAKNALNQVPDAAELLIDFRFVPGDPNFRSRKTAIQFVRDMDPEAEIEIVMFEGSTLVEEMHPLVRRLKESTERYKSIPVKMVHHHGTSDLRHVLVDPMSRGVEYGLGGAYPHADGEYLNLATVDIMYRALHDFLVSI